MDRSHGGRRSLVNYLLKVLAASALRSYHGDSREPDIIKSLKVQSNRRRDEMRGSSTTTLPKQAYIV